jgi:hypothetical protein
MALDSGFSDASAGIGDLNSDGYLTGSAAFRCYPGSLTESEDGVRNRR